MTKLYQNPNTIPAHDDICAQTHPELSGTDR